MDRRATLSPLVKSADSRKLLTDLQHIGTRLKEHFNNLLNQEGSAHPDACQQLKRKPTRNELCREITIEELKESFEGNSIWQSSWFGWYFLRYL